MRSVAIAATPDAATAEKRVRRLPAARSIDQPIGSSGQTEGSTNASTALPRRISKSAGTSSDDLLSDDLLSDDLLTDDLLTDDLLTDDLLTGDLLTDESRPDGFASDDLLSPDPLDRNGGGKGVPDMEADPLSEIRRDQTSLDGPRAGGASGDPGRSDDADPHEGLWIDGCYPSAESCRQCHPRQYDEWRNSGHAYSAVSPMFHQFDAAMAAYTRGTVGAFCVRCHVPVGTQLDMPRHANVLDGPPVVREGVTCIACHRIREHRGRSHGDRRIEPGDIHAPVGRSGSGASLRTALDNAKALKLKPHAGPGRGQDIHAGSYFFEPLTNSDVCVSCHQVAVHPGIYLEVVHAQYRAGPAAEKGITCQQCHMGEVPGKADGYAWGHAAELADKPYGPPRRVSNHSFWGPGFSIAHPGIFPQHPKSERFTPREWLQFDYRAGWGEKDFENTLPNIDESSMFPEVWANADDRRDARKIIDENLRRVDDKRAAAVVTMQAGIHIGQPTFLDRPRLGRPATVRYRVENRSDGHNLPTGSLGAQPQLWLNVVLVDPSGRRVYESGNLDSRGDLRDMHSVDVAKGRVRRDPDLFNLQTKFLINNVRGTDREVALPLNFSLDQLVFLRPGAVPTTVLNHPPLIRMEAHSIEPLGHRNADFHLPPSAFTVPGPYRLSVRARSRTEPMYFMRQIGCTPEMMTRMNERTLDLCLSSQTFMVR